jgi:hypothetical protein
VVSACGCRKSSPGPAEYISCDVNGVPKQFTTNFFVGNYYGVNQDSMLHTISIIGYTDSTDSAEVFGLTIDNKPSFTSNDPGIPLVTGTYSFHSPYYTLEAQYNPPLNLSSQIAYSGGFPRQTYPDSTDFFHLTITKINSTTIAGTFEGILYTDESWLPGPAYVRITSGQFQAKLQ